MAGDESGKKETEDSPLEEQETVTPPGEEAEPQDAENTGDDDVEARIQEAVEAALAEQKDTVLRAHAEVQNMRRRCEQDVEKAHKFALEKFAGEILTVVDNLERALESVPDSDDEGVKALNEGIELTFKGLLETLNRFKIEPVNPQGEPFDPQLHEAISMMENPDVEPNTVIAVIQKGYALNSRVIRPARVVVSKAATEKAPE